MKKTSTRIFGIVLGAGLALLLLIQAVPYGKNHQNPPVVQEPNWDSPATKELATRACYDCHSNETVWPWYSNIAPMSWLVQRDVDEGRRKLNFSEMQAGRGEMDELGEVVLEGEMPPPIYFPTHPEAKLSQAERSRLAQGFANTFGIEINAEED